MQIYNRKTAFVKGVASTFCEIFLPDYLNILPLNRLSKLQFLRFFQKKWLFRAHSMQKIVIFAEANGIKNLKKDG